MVFIKNSNVSLELSDKLYLNGDALDGLVIIGKLIEKLNTLENAYNQLNAEFKAHLHPVINAIPLAPPPAPPSAWGAPSGFGHPWPQPSRAPPASPMHPRQHNQTWRPPPQGWRGGGPGPGLGLDPHRDPSRPTLLSSGPAAPPTHWHPAPAPCFAISPFRPACTRFRSGASVISSEFSSFSITSSIKRR